MNDHVLVGALHDGAPDALAAVYDNCADDLFQYCWFMLRDREAARVALRDALVAAQAHIGRLRDPGLLRPWLFALARVERRRRRPAPADDPDVTVAWPDEPDASQRLTAWNAVMALPAPYREALYLAVKRDLEPELVGLVLGLPARDVGGLLNRARKSLDHTVIGEVLARAGRDGCPGRAAIAGNAVMLAASAREDLAKHAADCPMCSECVPHRVSAAKVFGVLPAPEPPPGTRLRTMTFLTDPELTGYRSLVARRAGPFTRSGFPAQDRRDGPAAGRGTPGAGLWVAVVSGAAAILACAVFALGSLGRLDAGTDGAQQGGALQPPGAAQDTPGSSGLIPGRSITPVLPLGAELPPPAREARPGSQLFVLGRQSLPAAGHQRGSPGQQPGGGAPQGPPPPTTGSRPPGQPQPSPTGQPTSPSSAPTPGPTRTGSPAQPGGPPSSASSSPPQSQPQTPPADKGRPASSARPSPGAGESGAGAPSSPPGTRGAATRPPAR